jgi:hypothetical protein
MATDQERALAFIVGVFDTLGVPYMVGGSVASSMHGMPRMTQDVDIVAAMEPKHVAPFVGAVRDAFYVDDVAIRDAIARRECFNAIHLDSVAKIDVFIRDASDWARSQWERRMRSRLTDAPDSPEVNVASAEDIVLQKLQWYRLGGSTSDRQWSDVLGVLRVRGAELDQGYLAEWAERLGLSDLLRRALRESRME